MKRTISKILALCLLGLICGCFQAHSDDDLRGVPVTNNPNILPKTRETAQGTMFGN